MVEPEKPFACTLPECGMTFTNEDHLHVHTKKHDMVLQLGLEQKAVFVADQTPTPTRFIRNCEEVGLFQDLQSVTENPFDEGFKKAMEAKLLSQGSLMSLDTPIGPSDDLHTPHPFPLDATEASLYSTINNQRNVTISRSSSDESGVIKEYETTTISKLTNEITTISRTVDKIMTNDTIKNTDVDKETVFKNNIVKIQNNIIIKKDDRGLLVYDKNETELQVPPMMSQKSIEYVVDSFTSGIEANPVMEDKEDDTSKNNDLKSTGVVRNARKDATGHRLAPKNNVAKNVRVEQDKVNANDIEVIIKMPNGKHVKMKAVDEVKADAKEILRKTITRKAHAKQLETLTSELVKNIPKIVPGVVKIQSGTLIPVTLINQAGLPLPPTEITKLPITKVDAIPNDIVKIPKQNGDFAKNVQNLPITVDSVTKIPIRGSNIVIPVTNNVISNVTGTLIPVNVSISNRENTVKKIEYNEEAHRSTKKGIDDNKDKIKKRKSDRGIDRTTEKVVVISEDSANSNSVSDKLSKHPEVVRRKFCGLESQRAASQRYRQKLKEFRKKQNDELKLLREANQKLMEERTALRQLITEHMKSCPRPEDLGFLQEKISRINNNIT